MVRRAGHTAAAAKADLLPFVQTAFETIALAKVSTSAPHAQQLGYLRDGYPPRLLRQLKRGQFSVGDDLDLHQMNAAAAQASIVAFLAEARRADVRCVRIVHGKGLRSKATGPVLKTLTDRMLRRRDDVIAFASARPAQGGTGAVIVLLKEQK